MADTSQNILVTNVKPDRNGITRIRQLRADGITIRENPGGILQVLAAPGGATNPTTVKVQPVPGQTEFTLPTPCSGAVFAFVNGLRLDSPDDFVVVGSKFHWVCPAYNLDSDDQLVIIYGV